MDARPINILLVEDDQVDVMNVQRAFKKANITNPLCVAGNGVEALAMLRSEKLRSPSPTSSRSWRRSIATGPWSRCPEARSSGRGARVES